MKIQVLRETDSGYLKLQWRQTKIQVLRETEFGYLHNNQDKRKFRCYMKLSLDICTRIKTNEIWGIKRMALTRVAGYQHGDAHRN